MTPSQMLEDIRIAAIKVNPEIAELKFGCRVKNRTGEGIVIAKRLNHLLIYDYSETNWILNFDFKIIGRDIVLADVLIILPHFIYLKHPYDLPNIIWFVNHSYDPFQRHCYPGMCSWDLTKPLHLQSEKTIRFIHELLP